MATCLDIFSISLDKMTSQEINEIFRTDVVSLFQFLLQRAEASGINNNVLEDKSIEAFCRLALRMTEKSLRHTYGQARFFNLYFGQNWRIYPKTLYKDFVAQKIFGLELICLSNFLNFLSR